MDSLVFRCPGCQQPFQVLAEQAGQMVRCPSCEEPVQIPESTSQTKPSAKTPAHSPADPPTQSPAETSAATTPSSTTDAEEVQPYECPECDKPFGIYPSMFGSQMACPHCQQTVLLQETKDLQTDVTPAAATAKIQQKRKQTLKARPKPPLQGPPKTKSATTEGETAAKVSLPSTPSSPKPFNKKAVSAPPVNAALEETAAVDHAEEPAPAVATAFQPLSVEHLLPPKFQAVDPAFFYRRHQDGSQVLLPGEDGSVNVVDNRIIRIEHNGKTYELISSPRYDRIQKSIVTNLLAVVICGLIIAIVMTLLNQ